MPPSLVKILLQILVITLPQGEENYSLPQATLFRKSVSPKQQKRVEENLICFIKTQSENMKVT